MTSHENVILTEETEEKGSGPSRSYSIVDGKLIF